MRHHEHREYTQHRVIYTLDPRGRIDVVIWDRIRLGNIPGHDDGFHIIRSIELRLRCIGEANDVVVFDVGQTAPIGGDEIPVALGNYGSFARHVDKTVHVS